MRGSWASEVGPLSLALSPLPRGEGIRGGGGAVYKVDVTFQTSTRNNAPPSH